MSTQSIAVYGAGGFGKEVRGMLELQFHQLNFAGYIDDFKKLEPSLMASRYEDVLIAISSSKIRQQLVENWKLRQVAFQRLISTDVRIHPSVQVGKGSIICPGTQLTVDITIGDFVIINLNATIGHDVVIHDYCSIMPSVNISGNVVLQKGVFVGTGATILQGITIGENAIIGAGALITKDVPPLATVIGVPGRIDSRFTSL
jgi:sugar O-acyltransferase (sialic acid O-acetyltransferase NeuD family)